MARQDGPGASLVYDAAHKWGELCLRDQKSLFTPESAIWSSDVAADLHARFVEHPDESNRDFLTKLKEQLAGAPAATVQLAGEILYVHLVILRSVGGKRKRELINTVLSWSSAPVAVPADLDAALDHGLLRGGTGFATYRPFLIAFIVRLVRAWTALRPDARSAALGDPWEFKRFVFSMTGRASLLQQHAMLHLVFPDTFEDIVSDDMKRKFAADPVYSSYVTDPAADVDRRLLQIREGVLNATGQPPRFFGAQDNAAAADDAPDDVPEPGDSVQYWKIAPGKGAWQWNECRQDGFIGIGWGSLGDLSGLTHTEFAARKAQYLKDRNAKGAGVEQAWRFSRIPVGARVLANQGKSIVLGFGTVTGAYYYEPGAMQPHRLRVRWDDVEPRRVKDSSWIGTLRPLTREKFEEYLLAPKLDPSEIQLAPPPADDAQDEIDSPDLEPVDADPSPLPAYSIEDCAADLHLEAEAVRRWVSALHRKGQAVLYGPPGTGKTYVATRIARHVVGGADGFVRTVQFHPSYSYEDFVEGIRPSTAPTGALSFSIVPGRFVEFCEEARSRTGPCVLILDEINRANLSRVFGELMYLLEYRDQSVALAGGRQFSVPRNVRIIGTMNTADRSVALVDHALRRRFAFLALHPEFGVLQKFHGKEDTDLIVRLIGELETLNKQIGNRHYEIGVSFFLQRDLRTHIEDIWRMEIEPYLEEYFFDQPNRVDAVRWDCMRKKLEL
ncbi:MAG: hypothetical protein HMLKMBBP_03122 [Planctomycetes bacterium]|nr:hypothetical protein [Planctomycetota bacterium]